MNSQSQFCLEVAELAVLVSSSAQGPELETPELVKGFLTRRDEPEARLSVSWSDLTEVERREEVFDSGALWRLYRHNGSYLYSFTSPLLGPDPYKVASLDLNFGSGKVSLRREYFEPQRPLYPLEYPLDELLMVSLLSLGRGAFVHACGVVDAEENGHLFVGQSGAGKTTMARLWQSHKNVKILSDDRIVLRKRGPQLYMYGTPWHGEAGFSTTARAPLTRIYFLRHAARNELIAKPEAEALGHLFSCSFPPFHSLEALDFSLSFLGEVVTAVPCFELRFLPDESVVELVGSSGGV